MQRVSEGGLVRVGVRWNELVPWRSFDVTTTWTPEEATIELAKIVGQSSFFGGADPVTPFVGAWVGDRFRFRPRLRRRSSFSPVIEARIEPHPRGARVRVTMRLSAFVILFMSVWMTGTTIIAIVALGAVLAGVPEGLLAPIVPVGGGLISAGAFASEARRTEALLRSLFPPAFSGEGLPPYR
jgi:hypothetical protein